MKRKIRTPVQRGGGHGSIFRLASRRVLPGCVNSHFGHFLPTRWCCLQVPCFQPVISRAGSSMFFRSFPLIISNLLGSVVLPGWANNVPFVDGIRSVIFPIENIHEVIIIIELDHHFMSIWISREHTKRFHVLEIWFCK